MFALRIAPLVLVAIILAQGIESDALPTNSTLSDGGVTESTAGATLRSTDCISTASMESMLSSMAPAGELNPFAASSGSVSIGCPTKLDASLRGSISDRTTCPYYYTEDYDPYRMPSLMLKAVCKCAPRKGSLTTSGRNKNNYCTPVHTVMPVLRLKDGYSPNGECLTMNDFYMSSENVAVACVAVPDRD